MAISLLMGNGINRLNNHGVSWIDVLHTMMARRAPGKALQFIEHKPFALVYEEILLSGTPKTGPTLAGAMLKDEMALKGLIAEESSNLAHNAFHTRIMKSGVNHILTTNYDYSFESAIGAKTHGKRVNLQPENKYSVFRRRTKAGKFVWHIHGEASAPNTITLGYDQYSGYLQKIRGYVTADRNKVGLVSPFKIGNLTFDTAPGTVYSWLDVFLRDDIHIVGLGLDYTEIDLWWALTYKGRLRARGHNVGETHFYEWHSRPLDEYMRAKHSMLKALGVEVHEQDCSAGFEPAYDSFIKTTL